jgi:hypothetical protein
MKRGFRDSRLGNCRSLYSRRFQESDGVAVIALSRPALPTPSLKESKLPRKTVHRTHRDARLLTVSRTRRVPKGTDLTLQGVFLSHFPLGAGQGAGPSDHEATVLAPRMPTLKLT